LGPIKAALGPERDAAFMEFMIRLNIPPDSEQLALAAANASFIVSLMEFRAWADERIAALEKAFAAMETGVEGRIDEAFTRNADEFQTEARLAARDLTQSEFRAAAVLRSEAIHAEVEALKIETQALAREREAARLRQIASVESVADAWARTGFAPAPAGPRFFGVAWTPAVFAAVAVAFVVGYAVSLVFVHSGVHRA
jgi:hypothetical protein